MEDTLAKFDRDGFSLSPVDVVEGKSWFYENKEGLSVYIRKGATAYFVDIPWKKLEPAIKRKLKHDEKENQQKRTTKK